MEKDIKNGRYRVSHGWRRKLQIWKKRTFKQTSLSSFGIEGQYELIWPSIIFISWHFILLIYFHKVSVFIYLIFYNLLTKLIENQQGGKAGSKRI